MLHRPPPQAERAPGGWPQFGSVVSKLQGPRDTSVPPFVSLCYTCTHGPYNEPGPGFLGIAHDSLRPMGPARHDMVLQGVTHDRLGDRQALLASLDRFRRDADASGKMDGMDAFTEQAMGILTSSRLAEALDLSKEDPRIGRALWHRRRQQFTSTTTAPRACRRAFCSPGGWSRPARGSSRSTTASGTGTAIRTARFSTAVRKT